MSILQIMRTKREEKSLQFNIIHYCKKKLISKNITICKGRKLYLCKHKDLLSLYNSTFSSHAHLDYQEYLRIKSDKSLGYVYVRD